MQGSVDAGDEFVLADFLAADGIAVPAGKPAASSSAGGDGGSEGGGNGSASNGAVRAPSGSSKSGGKSKKQLAADRRARLDRMPSMREEIDAW